MRPFTILGCQLITLVLASSDAAPPLDDPTVEHARALFEAARVHSAAEQFAPALEKLQPACDLFRRLGMPGDELACEGDLALVALRVGELELAAERAQRAVELGRAADDARALAEATQVLLAVAEKRSEASAPDETGSEIERLRARLEAAEQGESTQRRRRARDLSIMTGLLGIVAAFGLRGRRRSGRALGQQRRELDAALARLEQLEGTLPICSHCKRVRDEQGSWESVESYISARSDVDFTHGICPDCMKRHYDLT